MLHFTWPTRGAKVSVYNEWIWRLAVAVLISNLFARGTFGDTESFVSKATAGLQLIAESMYFSITAYAFCVS